MPGPVEATSSTLEVAHEDSVCHKIMKMNEFNFNTLSMNHNLSYMTLEVVS
jgi:hypothetical protein